jgi:hypothetical protein
MAGVDLFFERTPAAGPPWALLFGDLSGPAPPRTLEFAASFSELSFVARARSIVPCTASAIFPEMTFASSALYQSKTQRPTVARVITAWEKGASGEVGVDGPHRAAVRSPLGTQERWTSGDRLLLKASGAQFSAVKSDTRTASWFDGALICRPGSNSMTFQSADNAVRPNLQSAYQVAARLCASRVLDFVSTGVGQQAFLIGRWEQPLPHRLGTSNSAGCAVARDRGWQVVFQESMRPKAGRSAVNVVPIPPEPAPCYLPDTRLLFDAAWSATRELIFICERHPESAAGGQTVVVPIRRIYMILNNASLRRVDGNTLLPTFNMTLGLDADSWAWSFSATLPGRVLPDLEGGSTGSPVEVEALINGVAYRALVESIERSREFGSNDLRIAGRGKTALLDAPYAPTLNLTNTQARTAQQIMGDVLTVNGVSLGWEVQWGLVDWLIPAGVFSHQGSYIGAINKIAAAAGGYVQPHPSTQTIKILPRYPKAPWDWHTMTPNFELPMEATSRESLRWLEKPAYNRVFVSGQEVGVLAQVTRAGTAGNTLAPMVVDALITDSVAARQRGIAVLSDTGRQIEVSLRLPVLPETGIIEPGAIVEYRDGSISRRGLVRSTSVQAGLPEIWQTLGVQTYA